MNPTRPEDDTDRVREAQRVIVSLLGAADVMRRYLNRVTREHDLTLQQYNVLRILRGAGPDPLPTMQIAERMLEKTPGVTRFLDRLDEWGLVHRERSPDDRRRVDAWITPEGLKLLAKMDPHVDSADRAAIEGLTSDMVEQLVDSLDTVRDNTR